MYKHTHGFVGVTSNDECHIHYFSGCTSEGDNKPHHKHRIKGKTTCCNGHEHHFCMETSYDIPLPGGGHTHNFMGKVECEHCHSHMMKGSVAPARVSYEDYCKKELCKEKKEQEKAVKDAMEEQKKMQKHMCHNQVEAENICVPDMLNMFPQVAPEMKDECHEEHHEHHKHHKHHCKKEKCKCH